MAVKYWLPTVASDAGTGANWTGGTAPVDNDDVVVPSGTGAMTAFTGVTNIHILSWIVEEGYVNNIGSVGTPAPYSIERLEYRGTGASWWNELDTTPDISDEVVLESKRPISESDPAMTLLGGTWTRVLVNAGKCVIASGVSMTELETSFVQNPSADARVEVACAVPNLYMNGGTVRATGNLSASAGNQTMVAAGRLLIPSGSSTVGLLNISGGYCLHNSSGTITLANLLGSGILDFVTQVDPGTSAAVAKTITTLRWHRSASFLRDDRLVTITNTTFPFITREGYYMGLRGGR